MVDNHCHSLLKNFNKLDKSQFRSSFTESFDDLVIEDDMTYSLNYNHALSALCQKFQCKDEEGYIELRSSLPEREFVQGLYDEAKFHSLMVDDGLAQEMMIPIEQFGSLAGVKVYRILRIETELEKLVQKCNSTDQILSEFSKLVSKPYGSLVGLKTIAAYRGGLDIQEVSPQDANRALAERKLKGSRLKTDEFSRMNGDVLHHYLLREILAMVADDLPVQIHCGFGDIDLQLDKANPALLTPIFKDSRNKKRRFVLLHCYPYIEEACYLSSVFSNVFIDLSLSPFIVSPKMGEIYSTAISTTPTNKILAGTDGHSNPETHWYGALMARNGLSEALGDLVVRGFLNESKAKDIAFQVLNENALKLYRIS